MFLLYDGPSQFDGQPIIALATGIETPSTNRKTGPMVQTYILRKDIAPTLAVKSGQDYSICKDCMHRGTSCYVTVFQAPLQVWKSFQRHKPAALTAAELRAIGYRRNIRIGSYGDPAAVPSDIWAQLIAKANDFTGYTHDWRNSPAEIKRMCVASVDSESEQVEARELGWRTFRVLQTHEVSNRDEKLCPATIPNSRITCDRCMKCNGSKDSRRHFNIAAHVHGSKAKINHFNAA